MPQINWIKKNDSNSLENKGTETINPILSKLLSGEIDILIQ